MQPDGYYIGTYDQCEQYNATVTTGERYQGETTRWANVQSHPSEEQFAILKHKKYDSDEMQFVSELPDDWTPKEDELI